MGPDVSHKRLLFGLFFPNDFLPLELFLSISATLIMLKDATGWWDVSLHVKKKCDIFNFFALDIGPTSFFSISFVYFYLTNVDERCWVSNVWLAVTRWVLDVTLRPFLYKKCVISLTILSAGIPWSKKKSATGLTPRSPRPSAAAALLKMNEAATTSLWCDLFPQIKLLMPWIWKHNGKK
jgi:hypothetical protein